MFVDEEKPGQKELFNVLKAYSVLNPKVGYCQAQAPIAAFLLMHMPAEQAFWCFVSVCDKWVYDLWRLLSRESWIENSADLIFFWLSAYLQLAVEKNVS